MKLISCEIAGFGVLHHQTRTFTDGLNCVCAPNGEGKSTLAVFIKAMLYGLPQTTKRRLNDNERKHYQPWDGGLYGGSLTFETGGKRYRVERFFGTKESEDSFLLTDLGTNLPSTDFTENLGYELFGLRSDAYERSTYISQRMLSDKPENDDLRVKLTHLIEESGDFSGLEDALAILDKKRSEYCLRGGRGLIEDTELELQKTEKEIALLRGKCDSVRHDRILLRTLTERSDALRKERERYEETLKAVAEERMKREASDRLREMETEQGNLARKLREISEHLGTPLPTHEELAKKREQSERLIRLGAEIDATRLTAGEEERLKTLTSIFPNGCPTETTVENARRSLSRTADLRAENQRLELQVQNAEHLAEIRRATEKPQNKPFSKPLVLISGLVLFASAIALFVLSLTLPAVILLALGFFASVAFAWLIKKKKEKPKPEAEAETVKETDRLRREIAENDRLIAQLHGEAVALTGEGDDPARMLDALIADVGEYRFLTERRETIRCKRESIEREYDTLSDTISSYLSRWFDPDSGKPSELLGRLETELNGLAELTERLGETEKRLRKYRSEHPLPDRTAETERAALPTPEQLHAENERILRETDRLNGEIAQTKQRIEERSDSEEELAAAESRKDQLAEAADTYRKNLGTVEMTVKYLKQARINLSKRYLATMQESFCKYFAALTGKDATPYEMNADFEVTYRQNGKSYSAEYLSRGIRDAIAVCTRLALADALFEGEKPFLVLDDPLVNLDDEKQKNAAALIAAAANEYQILYFVCSRSRI